MLTQKEIIRETSVMKYHVIVNGKVLMEAATPGLAEQFVASLIPEQRTLAQIVPVTSEGKQILFG